ncbi:hypothetical protein G6553_01505 [Nocardioides sp. IC4_145]|uniref:hypothetical protein n=1 Tax=Nocardioides sp. IC4_145 TaxID=2714037 RepID=UPI0014093CCA|nr:hypothetical protein [Nocardioides sp. IC4_145]NHC21850.1 hypothetical protein [Nocardioides sp. IC4_145]
MEPTNTCHCLHQFKGRRLLNRELAADALNISVRHLDNVRKNPSFPQPRKVGKKPTWDYVVLCAYIATPGWAALKASTAEDAETPGKKKQGKKKAKTKTAGQKSASKNTDRTRV